MIIIGERINGMFRNVRAAIQEKDAAVVQDLARRQLEAGASILDVNVGPASDNPKEAMLWLVNSIQEAVDATLSLDSPNSEVIEAGLQLCRKPALINSTTGKQEDLDRLLPLAQQYGASLIGLMIDENGIPSTVEGRVEIGLRIVMEALAYDITPDRLYLDPIVLPVKHAQDQLPKVLEALVQFQMVSDPPPHTVVGLSNVSQGTLVRPLVNRTCLILCMARGLDSAILDPNDTELMDALITAELLMNKNLYCDSYLDAYRKSQRGG
jgi:5-methyltetrahydrofolate corrinoid/iron sulfur protein methyltransferase